MITGLPFGTRHVQCLMAFLAIASALCLRVNLSVAIVAMTQKSNSTEDTPVLPWDGPMKGTVQSSFFWGYLVCQTPGGQLAEKFGPKILLVIAIFVSSIVTLLTPFAAIHGGFYWMIFLRILMGAMQGFIFPSTSFLLSKWVPTSERGLLCNLVFSGMDFGILVTMVMAGALADSRWGWPSVFYVCGGITMLWTLVYACIGANSPQEHSSISEHEKAYILKSLPDSSQGKHDFKTPWKDLLTSVPVWGLTCAWLGENWGFYTILTQIPSYINATFGGNMKQSGALSALPYVASFTTGFFYAVMNDWLNRKKYLSRTALRKLWNSIAHWGSASALCLLAFTGDNETLVVALLIIAMTLYSANHVGCFSNHLDLSPNFSGTLMGITLTFGTLSSLGAPLYAGFVVTDLKSKLLWRIVFLTAAGMLFTGNLIFVIFGSGKVQPWNFPANEQKPCPETRISKEGKSKTTSEQIIKEKS